MKSASSSPWPCSWGSSVVAALAVGLFGCGGNAPSSAPPAGLGASSAASTPKFTVRVNNLRWNQNLHLQADRVLTPSNYAKIQPGMTYEEVIAILDLPPGPLRPDDDMKYVGPESDVELSWHGDPKEARS